MCHGATEHAVWAAMYGATVTLSDPTPPTLSAPSGALWGPGEAGGFHKGTESVTVSADDVGGGVASIVLSADGRPVGDLHGTMQFHLRAAVPVIHGDTDLDACRRRSSLTVRTRSRSSRLTRPAINRRSPRRKSPWRTARHRRPWGCPQPRRRAGGSTFTATWSDPAGQLAPITGALYQVCPASGSGACSAPASAPAAGRRP